MSSRPDAGDGYAAADDAFADVPGFDVVDGELLPRKSPFDRSGVAGAVPAAEQTAE